MQNMYDIMQHFSWSELEGNELKSRSCMSYKFIHGFLISLIVLNNN